MLIDNDSKVESQVNKGVITQMSCLKLTFQQQ